MQELNKQVHILRGLCFHETDGKSFYYCIHCHERYFKPNPDYSNNIADAWELFEEGKVCDKFLDELHKYIYETHWINKKRYVSWHYLPFRKIMKYINAEAICRAYIKFKKEEE